MFDSSAIAEAVGFLETDESAESRSAFKSGRTAALQGCLRILCCPESERELAEWRAGYDSVPKGEKGTMKPIVLTAPFDESLCAW